jgi:hypothetical protein
VKAHLLYPDQDFDFQAPLPPGHEDLVQDLELTALLRAVQRELDDEYFETLRRHLRQLQFRDGVPMSAELDRDNSGINYVLLSRGSRRSWKERIRIEPRSVYSFTIAPRDEAGAQTWKP